MKRLLLTVVLFVAALLNATEIPKPTAATLPTYPEEARTARVTGVVKLWFVLDENGAVKRAEIISGHPLLRQAALEDVKTWKFASESARPNTRYETEFVYKLAVRQQKGSPKLMVTLTDYRQVEISTELYVQAIE